MPEKPTMNDLIDYLWAWRKIASRAATRTANAANGALHQYFSVAVIEYSDGMAELVSLQYIRFLDSPEALA